MSWEYSENILIQKSADKVLQDKLVTVVTQFYER